MKKAFLKRPYIYTLGLAVLGLVFLSIEARTTGLLRDQEQSFILWLNSLEDFEGPPLIGLMFFGGLLGGGAFVLYAATVFIRNNEGDK